MASKPIEEWTTEELMSKRKTFKLLVFLMLGIAALIILTSIYLIVKKGFDSGTIAPMGGLVAIIGGSMPLNVMLGKINKELKKREQA